MTSPATLRFRAENFEAVATRVAEGPELGRPEPLTAWVIAVPCAVPRTVSVHQEAHGERLVIKCWSDTKGSWNWLWDTEFHDVPVALALAISLLYSVPGVEVYTPPVEAFPVSVTGTVVTPEWLYQACDGRIIRTERVGSKSVAEIALWCKRYPLGRYCFVDAGGLGKSLADDLQKRFGLNVQPLPKGVEVVT